MSVYEADVAVLGGGGGGYVAALRAAGLGRKVLLVDDRHRPGGTSLLDGCIPSKSLVHSVGLIQGARRARHHGLTFENLRVNLDTLRDTTQRHVDELASTLDRMLQSRGVTVVRQRGRVLDDHNLELDDGSRVLFQHLVLATGSRDEPLPQTRGLPVWTSSTAISIPEVPERLLVIGGGYIGMELGLVYAGLSSWVTLVEPFGHLLPGADPDLVDVLLEAVGDRFHDVHPHSRVIQVEQGEDGFVTTIARGDTTLKVESDQVLVAAGRVPNTDDIGLDRLGISVDSLGRIPVDASQRTALPHIYAVGDITRGPYLAHRAVREGKIAAEAIAGWTPPRPCKATPSVVFTDPEIGWTGLTETEATARGIPVKVGRFSLDRLGRAHTVERTMGMAKVLADPSTDVVLGIGMVGPSASEIMAEATLAIEMGTRLQDLLAMFHPHPTFSEAVMGAAEAALQDGSHFI